MALRQNVCAAAFVRSDQDEEGVQHAATLVLWEGKTRLVGRPD